MKIKKVELHAFRAYESRNSGTFNFVNEDESISNFISIYAPNGFGKTSFYDGVEWCMTNDINRFSKERKDIAFTERQQITSINHGRREKQYILKNKNVAASEDGEVNLFFNNNTVNRLIPRIGRGSSDYSFGTTIERKFFKDVVLSQEGIDNFLREDDSQGRFKKFIDYFGNESDVKNHNKLQVLKNKNNDSIDILNNEKKELETYISTPIDRTVFENSNKLINEFSQNGINFDLIEDTFTNNEKKVFDDKIGEFKININNIVDKDTNELNNLMTKESEVENYVHELRRLKILQEKYSNLNSLKDNYKKLKYIEEQKSINVKKVEEVENLIKIYPVYEKIENLISLKTEENNKCNLKKVNLNEEIYILEKNIKLSENTLDRKKQQKNLLDSTIIGTADNYKNLKVLENKVLENSKVIKEVENTLENLKYNLTNKIKESSQWGSHIDAVKHNIFLEIRDYMEFKESIAEIESLVDEFVSKEETLKKILEEGVLIKGYKSQIKELISIGSSIVNKNSLSSCPLCSKEYDGLKGLNNAINSNPLLDDIEKDYLEKKGTLEVEISTLEKKLNSQKTKLEIKLRNILDKIENDVKDLKSQVLKYEQTLASLNIENKSFLEEKNKILDEINGLEESEFISLKRKELDQLLKEIDKESNALNKLKKSLIEKSELIANINIEIDNNLAYIDEKKQNENYNIVVNYINQFEELINFEEKTSNLLITLKNEKEILFKDAKELNASIKLITNKYKIERLENLKKELNNLIIIIKELKSKISLFDIYLRDNFKKTTIPEVSQESLIELFSLKKSEIKKSIETNKEIVLKLRLLSEYTQNLVEYFKVINKEQRLGDINNILIKKNNVNDNINREIEYLESKIGADVRSFFYEESINKIYSKIDPHPEYKNVRFESTFKDGKGCLDIFVNDGQDSLISPSLYYSSAQLNVLSLSIFLAKALHAKDDEENSVDCIFIDDPIQSMDSINILATIDLFRSLVVNYDKQIILSTHDKNFHELLKKKVPTDIFGSKFIKLETFGKAIDDNE